MIQPADTLPGGLLIPMSVVQADNSHIFDIILTNVLCRKMEIPRRQMIVTVTNSDDLANRVVLSEEDTSEHTRSEIPVQLEVTDLSEE